tara:strand:- start:9679 stop:9786 length:108 start_codon:yes stop_codon:yes gene_type:complete
MEAEATMALLKNGPENRPVYCKELHAIKKTRHIDE